MTDGPATARELATAIEPFARSPDRAFVVDRDRRVVARNPAAEAAGAATDALAQVAPEAREALRDALDRAVERGQASTFEWGETGPEGVRAWYAAVVAPIAAGGGIAGAIASSRDVTALKRSAARLRRAEQLVVDVQGVAQLGTWEWEVARPTVTWSAELYRIYGVTPETYTPTYEGYLEKVHPDDRARVIEVTERVFREHVPYSHDERIVRPDGSIRFLHTWARPVRDEHGALVRLVGVCQDITDRKEPEQALERLNAELERRVAERTERLEATLHDLESFNAMVSHDLRGPLAVIQMGMDIVAGEALSPAATSALGRVQRAVDSMSALLGDLLELARLGEGALEPAEIDVSALCTDIAAELQQTARGRRVAITIAPQLRLFADPALLRLLLANLIGNAWKYTASAPSPQIEIGEVHRPEGRALFVRDNGVGFDMAESARLFRPCSRLSNAKPFAGAGMGLAIVQRIVERHGGTVRAEAAPGAGATFFVALPAAAWR